MIALLFNLIGFLLPPYPLYIILAVQQADNPTPGVQSGSYGKLFEGVITSVLLRSEYNKIGISDKFNYLSKLAYTMYASKTTKLSGNDARTWHNTYWNDIEINIDYDKLISDFVALGILDYSDDNVRFRYSYYFCFFVAYYIVMHLHTSENQALVKTLCGQLYHRLSADIVLFIANLTPNPIVLDELLTTCDGLFNRTPLATLEEDVTPLKLLGETIQKIAIHHKPDENRRRLKQEQDAEFAERIAAIKGHAEIDPPPIDNERASQLFNINSSYKTIQIIGQALRNMAASASKETKERVIDKTLALMRRLIGLVLQSLNDKSLEDTIHAMIESHKNQPGSEQQSIDKTHLYSDICNHIYNTVQFVCYALVKHATMSMWSSNLSQTIERILTDPDVAILRLVKVSFLLDKHSKFPIHEIEALRAPNKT